MIIHMSNALPPAAPPPLPTVVMGARYSRWKPAIDAAFVFAA
jgi:hypothetical protein